jgi:hypothetical protein
MSGQSKRTDNQSHEGIDDAVENSETRRQLSDDDLEKVAVGVLKEPIIKFGGSLLV